MARKSKGRRAGAVAALIWTPICHPSLTRARSFMDDKSTAISDPHAAAPPAVPLRVHAPSGSGRRPIAVALGNQYGRYRYRDSNPGLRGEEEGDGVSGSAAAQRRSIDSITCQSLKPSTAASAIGFPCTMSCSSARAAATLSASMLNFGPLRPLVIVQPKSKASIHRSIRPSSSGGLQQKAKSLQHPVELACDEASAVDPYWILRCLSVTRWIAKEPRQTASTHVM